MDLILPVKEIYFRQIQSGEKKFEFRLQTEYWKKRLVDKKYDRVIITLGYPKKDDMTRRLFFRWRGFFSLDSFTHEHFGAEPVKVFAIKLIKKEDIK